MAKARKWRPVRFCAGRGIPFHGGMKSLPKKKAAPGATNTQDGKAEQIEQPVSASITNKNKEEVK